MALSKGSPANWSDIQTLFTNLNTGRKKFNYSTISPSPAGGAGTTITTTNTISQLKTAIDGMKNNSYLSSTLSSFSVSIPARGTLITPTTLNTITSTISQINNTNAFDSFRSSFDGFSCSFDGFTCSFDSFSSNSNNRQFGFGYRVEKSTCEY